MSNSKNEHGWAQNEDGTLKEASELSGWVDSPTDEEPKLTWPEPTLLSTITEELPAGTETPFVVESQTKKRKTVGDGGSAVQPVKMKQRNSLSYAAKIEILDYCTSGPGASQRQQDVAEHFQVRWPWVTQATVSKILSSRKELEKKRKDDPDRLKFKRPGHFKVPELEAVMTLWFNTNQDVLTMTSEIIRAKATKLAQDMGIPSNKIQFSKGWVEAFKARHGIRQISRHGEAASVSPDQVALARRKLKQILSEYKPCDIYNFDETALFWRMLPSKTLANKKLSGVKGDKTRMTFGFITNANGSDIRPPLIIGHARRPRCFKGREASNLGFYYFWNKTAWMETSIWQMYATISCVENLNSCFIRFLRDLNAEMAEKGRHIILLSDNCSSHLKFKKEDYPNVRVEFFPPRMTSHIQPMDAGIIRAWKAYYRSLRVLRILERHEDEEVEIYLLDQLEAMHMALIAWGRLSRETVQNCWQHTGILGGEMDKTDIPIDPALLTPGNQVVSAVAELGEALAKLNGDHIAKNDVLTAEEWLELPEEKITEGTWSDEDILEQYEINKREANGEHISELEVDPEPTPKPKVSLTQALEALDLYDRYLEDNPTTQSHELLLKHRALKRGMRLEVSSSLKQPPLKFSG